MDGDDGRGFFLVDEVDMDTELEDDLTLTPEILEAYNKNEKFTNTRKAATNFDNQERVKQRGSYIGRLLERNTPNTTIEFVLSELPADPAEAQRQIQDGEVTSVNSQWEKADEKSAKGNEEIQEGSPASSDAEPPPLVTFDQSQPDIPGMAEVGQLTYILITGGDQEGDRIPQEVEVAGDQPDKEEKDDEKKKQD